MDFWLSILIVLLTFSLVAKPDSESDKTRICLFQIVVITNITIGLLFKS